LRERTTFVRQAANLWQVKVLIQQHIVSISGQHNDESQIIDTAPLPVCEYVRSRRDKCFAHIGIADKLARRGNKASHD